MTVVISEGSLRHVACVAGNLMRTLTLSILLASTLVTGCVTDGSEAGDSSTPSADGKSDGATAATTVTSGTFAMLTSPGLALSPFGCRHYMELNLFNSAHRATATFEAALDSDDPADMDADGCGGEEFPHATGLRYRLLEVSHDECGGRVLEGTVKWTTSGRVTRTLRIHDNRKACGHPEADIVLEELRALDGESNLVETYFNTVD